MHKFFLLIYSLMLMALARSGVVSPTPSPSPTPTPSMTPAPIVTPAPLESVYMLKDVGEAYLDHFGLTEADFAQIAAAGFNAIEGNFDICASDEDVNFFLDQAQAHGLQVIMSAGAGEAEWGYECDAEIDPSQQPVWNKEGVVAWVNKWKSHPAIYGWDTSNEAGGNFPNSDQDYWLTLVQLQAAYGDVKEADPARPVIIRMNGWYFYDYDTDFFRTGNPFGVDVADIVMVNAYSNVEDYYDDFVATVSARAKSAIKLLDLDTRIIVALGVWEEGPLWYLPSVEHLRSDEVALVNIKPLGTAYFKYGAQGSEWYLPESAPQIWQALQK